MVAISQNFGSRNALYNLTRSNNTQSDTLVRLSSGVRLQESADDPSVFAIANDLRSEVKSMRQMRTSQFQSMSAIEVAHSNLDVAINTLTRAAELATQAASTAVAGDNSFNKQILDTEYQDLLAQVDQLNDTAAFNDLTLFGSVGATFTVNLTLDASSPSEQLTVTTQPFRGADLGLAGTSLDTAANADAALTQLTASIENLTRQQGALGAQQRRISLNLDAVMNRISELTYQEAQIYDADVARETVTLTKTQILTQSNVAVMAQGNISAERALSLIG